MDKIWDGAFFKRRGTVDNPRNLDTSHHKTSQSFVNSIPEPYELEVYDISDEVAHTVIDSFIYDGIQYVAVQFDHTNICYEGEVAPSNETIYIYILDEEEIEEE